MGGEEEKRRARELLAYVTVVEDQVSERVARLKEGGKIKARSKVIFGSGDHYRAPTVTANKGFVQAAENQGVRLAVVLHESRALAEQKTGHADPV